MLKERFLRVVLGGVSRQDVDDWTKSFLKGNIIRWLSRDGLRVLEEHRQAGDRLVLLTASPDCYVTELACLLKFDDVICTKVEWLNDRLTGRLTGPNMRGEEKARILRAVREKFQGSEVVAYADNQSDIAMLRMADRGVLVNGNAKIRQRALEDGIHVVRWS